LIRILRNLAFELDKKGRQVIHQTSCGSALPTTIRKNRHDRIKETKLRTGKLQKQLFLAARI
jgi:hypothetical protein